MSKVPSLKTVSVCLHDILILIAALALSFSLRFTSYNKVVSSFGSLDLFVIVVLLTQFTALFILKPYRHIWRYLSINDVYKILSFSILSTVAPLVILFFFRELDNVPRSIFLIDGSLIFFLMLLSRVIYKVLRPHTQSNQNKDKTPVIIIGAGEAGERFIQECSSPYSPLNYQVVGILDDDPRKLGRTIQGIKIQGTTKHLDKLVKKTLAKTAIICIPSATANQVKSILKKAVDADIKIKTLPKYQDILDSDYTKQLKNVDIDDLLGRPSIKIAQQALYAPITHKKIMITGGGGSIGSEIVRQLISHAPSQIIVVDFSEFFVYELSIELGNKNNSTSLFFEIGDVRNKVQMETIFQKYQPDFVFHAAAYKHVPIMENHPFDAVHTNIMGTLNLAQLATENNIPNFTMISTDKAVNPTNIMGASKRIAEMICTSFNTLESDTVFSVVRFGNVLGSNGSVIPLFQKQLSKGGPITVTHPNIERYFMSIPEASRLVILSACLANKGEIFVLDMGEPIKIVQLAKNLILLSGYKENEIEIEFTGLRPGEKLYEELFSSHESTHKETPHPKIRIAQQRELPSDFQTKLNNIIGTGYKSNKLDIIKSVQELVIEYSPDLKG